MRLPLTLVDASVMANLSADLSAIAASQRNTPCHCVAKHLAQIARQVASSYSEAQAVANFTEVPAANRTFSENVFAEQTFSSGTVSDTGYSDPGS